VTYAPLDVTLSALPENAYDASCFVTSSDMVRSPTCDKQERCYYQRVQVKSKSGPFWHWTATMHKNWCGVRYRRITRRSTTTEGEVNTCWSGPAQPSHSTTKVSATHERTEMRGKFTFQCGWMYKQQNLWAGVDYWASGARKPWNKTTN
jgi:hypothetical protein